MSYDDAMDVGDDSPTLILPPSFLDDLDEDNDVFGNREDDEYIGEEEDNTLGLPEDDGYLANEVLDQVPEDESTPQDGFYWFLLVFVFYFQMRFLSESAGILMLRFINAILDKISKPFRMPETILTLRKRVGADRIITEGITQYAVCPKCHKLFRLGDVRIFNMQQYCDHQEFPEDDPCDTALFKRSTGNRFIPKKIFVYRSIKDTIGLFLSRPGFIESIDHWKNRIVNGNGVLYDVYDGAMWRELKDSNGETFVDGDLSLMLTLNVDWFQPFDTGRVHSVGGIYLVINNLPRMARFKPENAILVGIIPGPKEPSNHQINHYLQPMVDELKMLYHGQHIRVTGAHNPLFVRAALLMVACDIPAARKVSGFTGINSLCACYKCERRFEARGDGGPQRDFSGFHDVHQWKLRSGVDNRQQAIRWRTCSSSRRRLELEQENGTRWSALHELSYFDAVRCTIVDPMHNLYSGTAKRCINTWKALEDDIRARKTLTTSTFEGNDRIGHYYVCI